MLFFFGLLKYYFIYFFFKNQLIYLNWRIITLQYCGDFPHTLTWISHGCACVPPYLFIWLCWVLVPACRIFSCSTWDLVHWPWMEPRPPALGAWSLSHWTTREVPTLSNPHSSKWMNKVNNESLLCVMDNFMCQLDGATGGPALRLNFISGCIWESVSGRD